MSELAEVMLNTIIISNSDKDLPSHSALDIDSVAVASVAISNAGYVVQRSYDSACFV
jgi:hypothetical protein